jgi:hypothetical protein
MLRASKDYLLPSIFGLITRDGILGHQFNKKTRVFAPCYSQSLLLVDFKENQAPLWFSNLLQKNPRDKKKLEFIHV